MNRKERRSQQAETRKAPPGMLDPELRDMMRQAVAQHRAGHIDQAVAGYEAVLAREPRHTDALQFMGVAMMQSGRAEEAVELLRRAVAAHPANSQAQYNLGLAMREVGREAKALAAFRRAVAAEPRNFEARTALAGMLLESFDELDAAEDHLRRALAANPDYAPARGNLALVLKARGQLGDAAKEAREAVRLAPGHVPGLITLGSLLLESGEAEEAEKILRDAVSLAPENAQAHTNLGAALKFSGAEAEAEAEFARALELEPENFQGLSNLALIRGNQGRLDEAESLLKRATSLNPEDPAPHASLGAIQRRRQQWGEAITSFRQALDLDAGNSYRAQDFVDSLSGAHFLLANAQLWKDLERGLRLEGVNHQPLALAAARLLRNSQQVAPLVDAAARGAFALSAMEVQKGDVLSPLSTAFANLLLCRVAIPDTALEELFIAVRRSLLKLAVDGRLPERMPAPTLEFICALARQCFLNEYVYAESAEETANAESLCRQIDERLRQPDERPPRGALAVLACYRSLDGLATRTVVEGDKSAARNDAFGRLVTQQIRNPAAERALKEEIPDRGESGDETSQKVRRQYEESPYPRWTNAALAHPRPLRTLLGELFPYADLAGVDVSAEPDLLIAGCGTGAHAVAAALRYRNSRVLALDLSLASLAYGKRQADALGIDRIAWERGDILALAGEERRFDMVDCGGVLHHMREPMAGWRILRDLLKPGGVMKIGLYSELARRDIAPAAAGPAVAEVSAGRIRAHRREIMALPDDSPRKRVMALGDFYTLSECRDLLFHVEEHRFTLPEISRALAELDLEFIGFEMRERTAIDRYRVRFPDDPAAVNLENWHRYETDNPDTFIAMYQFWVRPRAAAA
jgi:tetratricopeptide (TPR) repeat protein/SAM-dependent methyltransferase